MFALPNVALEDPIDVTESRWFRHDERIQALALLG